MERKVKFLRWAAAVKVGMLDEIGSTSSTGGIKMKKNYFSLVFVALLLLSGRAFAVEENSGNFYYDPETNRIYSGTKKQEIYSLDNYRESARSSSANIDVITREDIKRQNTPSLTEMLSQLGSVTTQNSNGSAGNATSVRIRGTDRVRLTIDGVRADRPSLTTAGVESQFLLLEDIEVVEVICFL